MGRYTRMSHRAMSEVTSMRLEAYNYNETMSTLIQVTLTSLLVILGQNLLHGQSLTMFGGMEGSNTSVIFSLKNETNAKGDYKIAPRLGVRYRQPIWKCVGIQAELRYVTRHPPDLVLIIARNNPFLLTGLQIPVHRQSEPEGSYSVSQFGGPYLSGRWAFFAVAPDVQFTVYKKFSVGIAPKYSYGRLLNADEAGVTADKLSPGITRIFERLGGRDPVTNEVLIDVDRMNSVSHEFGGMASVSYKLTDHFAIGAEYERYFGRSRLFQSKQYFSWLDEARWVGYHLGLNATYIF